MQEVPGRLQPPSRSGPFLALAWICAVAAIGSTSYGISQLLGFDQRMDFITTKLGPLGGLLLTIRGAGLIGVGAVLGALAVMFAVFFATAERYEQH